MSFTSSFSIEKLTLFFLEELAEDFDGILSKSKSDGFVFRIFCLVHYWVIRFAGI